MSDSRNSEDQSGAQIRRPKILLTTALVIIFVTEATVMFVISLLPPMSLLGQALFNAILLALLLFPIMYFMMYRPMSREVLELTDAMARIKTLEGIVPICMHCHKMRTNKDVWERLEVYLAEHSQAQLSHSLCPECRDEHYSDLFEGD